MNIFIMDYVFCHCLILEHDLRFLSEFSVTLMHLHVKSSYLTLDSVLDILIYFSSERSDTVRRCGDYDCLP